MIQNWFGASYGPKIAASFAALALIFGQVSAMVDGDAKTVPDFSLVMTQVMIIVALFRVRSNQVSSEMVRAESRKH